MNYSPAELNGVRASRLPNLYSASIEELSAGLAAGLFSSLELTLSYIGRIQEVNAQLHAVLELNPVRCVTLALPSADNSLQYAALDAHRLDQERTAGRVRGPLHGIPIVSLPSR